VVTIEGSNLGINFEDVMKIMIGEVNCTPNEDFYVVGRRYNIVHMSCMVNIILSTGLIV